MKIYRSQLGKLFKSQYRVLRALFIREILTRWGRKNIGFLWIFGEPLGMMLFYFLFWKARGEFSNLIWARYKISIIGFIIVGHASYLMWSNSLNLSRNAIRSNSGLLHHKNILPLDIYLARILLEIVASTGSFVILMSIFIFLEIIPAPKDLSLILFAWILCAWFSIGFGTTFGSILAQYEFLAAPWRLFAVLLFFTSGVFFYAAWIPQPYFSYLIWSPTLQINEMLKHGYFGSIVKTYENIGYISISCLTLTFSGFLLIKHFGKHLPSRL